jgi:O-antigen ligase
MSPKLVLLFSVAVFGWLIKRDIALRKDASPAVWIPTLWIAILASRPFSMWLGGVGTGDDSLEGSPTDRLFYLSLIIAAFVVLCRRGFNWGEWISNNKALLAFYFYFLISILWADSTVSSFKRLFKDFGNIIVLLVILTDKNPRSALKAVFVRCAYVLIPLSLVYIRYFPELGRRYNRSGALEQIGVTYQKNSLGALILYTGLFLILDLMDNSPGTPELNRWDKRLRLLILTMGGYLLYLCDSKTSLFCLLVGVALLLCSRVAFFQRYMARAGVFMLVGTLLFFALDSSFHLRETLFSTLGRDMTLTGRTDVWREILNLKTDPVFGVGFCSIWSDKHFLNQLPDWVSGSAHNGYLEMYLDGGFIGLAFLTVLLITAYWKATVQLRTFDDFAVLRFAIIVITLIYNYSESVYGRLSPGWFLFLLAAVDYRPPAAAEADENWIEAEEIDSTTQESPHHERPAFS